MAAAEASPRSRRSPWRWLLAALALGGVAVWWLATAYYELAPGEAAVVLRLGALARVETREGIHFLHAPRPLETLRVVKTGVRKRIEFGDVDATDSERLEESAMQTGDNNLVLVEFAVQYRVGRPFEALYRLEENEDTLWDVAQAAMREVVGRESVDGVLVDRKSAIAQDAADRMQEMLDLYESGLVVESVDILDAQPPAALRAAFNDAQAARQDKTRQVNEAEGYANEVVPRAHGEAAELTATAAGYRSARVAEAGGEAARFRALAAEHARAPLVTRQRLYLETLEAVLPDAELIVAEPGAVLPYLPIERSRAREGKR
jgi:membrane protease subunit HflK